MPDVLNSKNDNYFLHYAGIVILSGAVFILDLTMPLGTTGWILYLFPLLLSAQQPHSKLPYITAICQCVLLLIGFYFSSPGIPEHLVVANRIFGAIGLFSVAYLGHRIINERRRAEHLLWIEQGRTELSRVLLLEKDIHDIASDVLHTLAKYLNAQVGMLYLVEGDMLRPTGSFAANLTADMQAGLPIGQGMAGEVAKRGEITVIQDIPANHLKVTSLIGEVTPSHIVVTPIIAEERILGVIELGFVQFTRSAEQQKEFFSLVADKIGIGIRSALYRQRMKDLLEETQRQSEQLQTQQEELRVTNEELQEQSRALQKSHAELETQQVELERANAQLENRTVRLEEQKHELIKTQSALERKAEELDKASRYKSEFLANMSHELRTPLNSSLILSQILGENKAGNLTDEQVKFARTIYSANSDLLTLINDILDLSKIEAGQVIVQPEPVTVRSIMDALRQIFEPVATQRNIRFNLTSRDAPNEIVTDSQRLQQILKNLLSNAFKFTERGEVALEIARVSPDRIAISVRDTGIGIPEHQQEVIFEAFRQADGSTSRTYGGTGLGLSISREMAQLLGGAIRVQSVVGQGSTFSLEIPIVLETETAPVPAPAFAPSPNAAPRHAEAMPAAHTGNEHQPNAGSEQAPELEPIDDDRGARKFERLILIVEDDARFAALLCDLVHEMRFDCMHAPTGGAALRLAKEFQPDAILLDVRLPDYSGLSLLEQFKRDPVTRHVPVHMISVDDYRQTALELGAIGYSLKPVAREEVLLALDKLQNKLSREVNRILLVEDNPELRESLVKLLGSSGTEIVSAATATDALAYLTQSTFDCMVMDLMLPDMSGYDMLEEMAKGTKYAFPPVIVYTGRVLSRDEEQRLRRYSQSIIIKGAKSPERLLDEVSLFLHKVESTLPPEHQQILKQARQRDAVFEGRRILIAEDDVRNVFALTSIFEPLGANVVITRNGKEALEHLGANKEIDLVLMDLMMPEMDGLTAIREIRKLPELKNMPIIALTAKAMPMDRNDCLDAGANDYIAKPINVDQLVSLCRVWMPK